MRGHHKHLSKFNYCYINLYNIYYNILCNLLLIRNLKILPDPVTGKYTEILQNLPKRKRKNKND